MPTPWYQKEEEERNKARVANIVRDYERRMMEACSVRQVSGCHDLRGHAKWDQGCGRPHNCKSDDVLRHVSKQVHKYNSNAWSINSLPVEPAKDSEEEKWLCEETSSEGTVKDQEEEVSFREEAPVKDAEDEQSPFSDTSSECTVQGAGEEDLTDSDIWSQAGKEELGE
jgi:hypothetical protein